MGGEWPEHDLSSLTELIADCPHSTPKWTNEGVIVLRNQNIRNGRLNLSSPSYTDEKGYKARIKRAEPKAGDLVFTREAPMGEVCMIPEGVRCCLGQRMVLIRPNKTKCHPKFLLYAIQSPYLQHQIGWNEGTGSTVSNIRIPYIKSFKIPAPSLQEQATIAGILSSLDDKIELNRQLNQTLEQMAQAIFKSWFIDFDPVVYNAVQAGNPVPERFQATAERYRQSPDIQTLPQHILDLFPDRFEESELEEIPAGWEAVRLDEVIDVNPKRTLKKGTVATYLDMKNMPTKGMRPTDWWDREFKSGSRFINGDTLVARITPCLENGKTAYVNFLQEGEVCWGSTEYIVLRPKAPLPTEYSYFLARESGFRDHAIANMTGSSGRQRVPASSISSYPVIKAKPTVYEEFSRQVSPIAERIKEQDEENRTLSALRGTLLPKLIAGDLRIPDAEKLAEGLNE